MASSAQTLNALDNLLDDPFLDGLDFSSPLTIFRLRSGFQLRAWTEPSPNGLCFYKLGDNHYHVLRAQQLLNCFIRANVGGPWRKDNGSLWPPLLENGMLDAPTQAALRRVQQLWGMRSTGCLCPKTRMLLHPFARLKGSLWLLNQKSHKPCLTQPFSKPRQAVVPNTPIVPNPVGKSVPITPNGQSPSPNTSNSNDKKADDDDKPWTLTLTPSVGTGISGPIFTGKSASGNRVKRDKLEWDEKNEIDLSLSTSLALGDGHLKLTLSGEHDEPIDRAHRGKRTLQGGFQLQADDFLKFDWGSISPYVSGSRQWQKDDDKWKQATTVKGGVELDVNLWKGWKVATDVNSGVQVAGPGSDPKSDAKLIVPWEANVRIQVDIP